MEVEGEEDVVALVVLNMVLVLVFEEAETNVETRVCHHSFWGKTYCLPPSSIFRSLLCGKDKIQ